MHDVTAFLQPLANNLDDITARLVFADWLEEQGCPYKARWAKLIRLQCDGGEDVQLELDVVACWGVYTSDVLRLYKGIPVHLTMQRTNLWVPLTGNGINVPNPAFSQLLQQPELQLVRQMQVKGFQCRHTMLQNGVRQPPFSCISDRGAVDRYEADRHRIPWEVGERIAADPRIVKGTQGDSTSWSSDNEQTLLAAVGAAFVRFGRQEHTNG